MAMAMVLLYIYIYYYNLFAMFCHNICYNITIYNLPIIVISMAMVIYIYGHLNEFSTQDGNDGAFGPEFFGQMVKCAELGTGPR